MLIKEIMAVLSEGGSECIGSRKSHTNYKNMKMSSFPKLGSLYFIFVPKLDIEERNFS